MANIISTPSTGQPIDTQYIYDIANALNTINNNINSDSSSRYQTATTQVNAKTSNLVIWTGIIAGEQSKQVTKDSVTTKTVTFDNVKFGNTPVVTATICNSTNNTVKPTLSMGVPSSTQVSFNITYSGTGKVSFDLHVIAIGI